MCDSISLTRGVLYNCCNCICLCPTRFASIPHSFDMMGGYSVISRCLFICFLLPHSFITHQKEMSALDCWEIPNRSNTQFRKHPVHRSYSLLLTTQFYKHYQTSPDIWLKLQRLPSHIVIINFIYSFLSQISTLPTLKLSPRVLL